MQEWGRMQHTHLGRGMGLMEVLSRLPIQRSIEGQLEIAKKESTQHRLATHFTNLMMWFNGVLTTTTGGYERLPVLR